jgi:NADPH-dependent glutamate synthase beta subunit-like oxidoreductase/NAD-dependent dihydropyrimidine dehydrogenase PreA subunit
LRNEKLKVTAHPLEWYRDNVPCRTACPVDTDSGRYVQLIAEGRYDEAFRVARSPNPLASTCGRVCAAPCEDACRRGAIDEPISIRALKRFVTERYGSESTQPDTFRDLLRSHKSAGAQSPGHLSAFPVEVKASGRRVAILGSGPAGLAAAHDLALMGHEVTIFEAADEAGGMMRYGIPEYRLPRGVLAKEIRNIQSLGVTIRTKSPITRDFGISHLRSVGYDAIFVGVGTQAGSGLNIPGADLDGVIKAVDYLININQGYRVNLGDDVLVIGGGSVALDAARTAKRVVYSPEDAIEATAQAGALHVAIDVARSARREGSLNVHVASLESFDQLPAAATTQGREELREAELEGVTFHPSSGPRAIIGEDGRVKGIELIEVASIFDADGRFNPTYVEGTEKFHAFDSVILAIGQQAETSFILPEDGIELTPRGTIKADPETLKTSSPGVYAGGDVVYGPRILIEAVENGKRAARSIDSYLGGTATEERTKVTIEHIPIDEYVMPPAFEKRARCRPHAITSDRRTGISEVEEVYEENEAVVQAQRCLQCHIETVYDADLCVVCNRCVDVCPEECLLLVPIDQVEITGLDVSEFTAKSQKDEAFSVMLKDHTRCIRCGLCALRCPTNAWTMHRLDFSDVIEDN